MPVIFTWANQALIKLALIAAANTESPIRSISSSHPLEAL